MKKMFSGGKQMHNLTSYGSGSTSQKVTVPTVPVPVPQHWNLGFGKVGW